MKQLNGVNINDNAVSISDTQAAQGAQQTNIQTHRNRSQEHDKGQSKKFTFVVYGIKECPQGSTRLTHSTNDIKEVSDTVARIDPEFSSKSICDCTRLGRYSPEKNRPILVRLSRSYEATNILDNRRKLRECPGLFIKPFLSKEELSVESILLKERRKLIDSGTERKSIKIKGKTLHVNNSIYGSLQGSNFVLSTNEVPVFLGESQTGQPNTN